MLSTLLILLLPKALLVDSIQYGQSEVVKIIGMGDASNLISNPVSNCPHLQAGLIPLSNIYPYSTISNGMDISIVGNVLLSSKSIPNNVILNRITVLSGGNLIFDDSTIILHVREIYIQSSASLQIGSETCRLGSNINITFHGTQSDSSLVDTTTGVTSKGLISEGFVDIHGKQYHPTWTRISVTATKGSSYINLQQNVNWEVGQEILITTTVFYDCPDKYYASWCNGNKHQNEVRLIKSISMNGVTNQFIIQLNTPLLYDHYAGLSIL